MINFISTSGSQAFGRPFLKANKNIHKEMPRKLANFVDIKILVYIQYTIFSTEECLKCDQSLTSNLYDIIVSYLYDCH